MDLFKKKDRFGIEAQASEKREKVLDSSQRKIKGHTLFEYNTVTGEISVGTLTIAKRNVVFKGQSEFNESQIQGKFQVLKKPNCIYRQALNKKNMIKVLKREGYELFK